MLVRLAPGASYPPHAHAGVEELHLLDGELWINGRKLMPGDYNCGSPGAGDDRVWSETGCTCVLVTSSQAYEANEARAKEQQRTRLRHGSSTRRRKRAGRTARTGRKERNGRRGFETPDRSLATPLVSGYRNRCMNASRHLVLAISQAAFVRQFRRSFPDQPGRAATDRSARCRR